ncbi:hypothetical protein EXIGLDRAFT_731083 [Exidia glandulosa HHB12029]|uniref:Uncharacterized protein n=1 Tax=Exidia glandulosa HHB12029 TaxID=1314781 RepID=A0A165L5J5_EXIGL|nr:hypothetical protein EXIGLDRAFT_731083 [Exidia glandulosa HHB12029]
MDPALLRSLLVVPIAHRNPRHLRRRGRITTSPLAAQTSFSLLELAFAWHLVLEPVMYILSMHTYAIHVQLMPFHLRLFHHPRYGAEP